MATGAGPPPGSRRAAGEDVEPDVVDRQRVRQARERRAQEPLAQLLGQPLEEGAEADRAQVAGAVARVDLDPREPAPDVREAGRTQAALRLLRGGEVPVAGPIAEVLRVRRLGR